MIPFHHIPKHDVLYNKMDLIPELNNKQLDRLSDLILVI